MDTRFVVKFLAILLLLSASACYREEPDQREFPRLRTLEVSDISASGATFRAQLLDPGREPIREYGFLWDSELVPQLDYSLRQRVEGGPDGERIDLDVVDNLVAGTIYQVRAYLLTDSYRVLGNIVTFTSQGGRAPEITGLAPDSGYWGDTISLNGRYFGRRTQDSGVFFGERAAQVISSSDTAVRCIVPSGLRSERTEVRIRVAEKTSERPAAFDVSGAIVQGFSPQTGAFETPITISGDRFSTEHSGNEVLFGETPAYNFVSQETQRLVVRVPSTLEQAEAPISVITNGRRVAVPGVFRLEPPVIAQVTTGQYEHQLYIEGSGFNFVYERKNRVRIDGFAADVWDANPTRLIIDLPIGPYRSRQVTLSVTVAGQTTSKSHFLTNLLIRRADIPLPAVAPVHLVTFAAGGYGFAGLGELGEGVFCDCRALWRFAPDEGVWTGVRAFPGGGRTRPVSFSNGDKGYVGLGFDQAGQPLTDLWQYDPRADQWTRRASLPEAAGEQSAAFVAGGRAYLLTGLPLRLWEYDMTADRWTDRGEAPNPQFPGLPESAAVVDGAVFIHLTTGPPGEKFGYLVPFDPLTRRWSPTWLGIGLPYGISPLLAVGGQVVITQANILRTARPGNNWWQDAYRNSPAYSAISGFALGGRLYLVGGRTSDQTPLRENWEYLPPR